MGEHVSTEIESQPLAGLRIAIPETRQLDVLADMLERRGAESWRCPLVSILDTPDEGPVREWLARFNAGDMDDLILLTGEGLRRLTAFAERDGCRDDFVQALSRVRKLTRGPKPNNALRELGLSTDMAANAPTTEGVIDTLTSLDLSGRRVGVQLYGEEPNHKLQSFLQDQGAVADVVAPYVYATESDDGAVQDLIRGLLGGELDAMAFTSQPQVRRLLKVAQAMDVEAELIRALEGITVIAVGPVVAERLQQAGIGVDVMPETSYFMKPMVRALMAKVGQPD